MYPCSLKGIKTKVKFNNNYLSGKLIECFVWDSSKIIDTVLEDKIKLFFWHPLAMCASRRSCSHFQVWCWNTYYSEVSESLLCSCISIPYSRTFSAETRLSSFVSGSLRLIFFFSASLPFLRFPSYSPFTSFTE